MGFEYDIFIRNPFILKIIGLNLYRTGLTSWVEIF